MIRVQNQAHIKRFCHGLGGLGAIEHVQEILRHGERRIGVHNWLALSMSIKARDQRRRFGEQSNGLAVVGFNTVIFDFGVKQRERADKRAQHMHWSRIAWHFTDKIHKRWRQRVLGAKLPAERVQLRLGWQATVPQQEHRLFKCAVARECVNFNSNIFKNASPAVNKRHLRFRGDGVSKAFVKCGCYWCCDTHIGSLKIDESS